MISSLDKRKLKINSVFTDWQTSFNFKLVNSNHMVDQLASYIEAQFTTCYSWQSL